MQATHAAAAKMIAAGSTMRDTPHIMHTHKSVHMGTHLYDKASPKRRTNVSVNADLLEQARALNVNLSAALEEKLVEIVRREREKRWLEENRAA
ncbi:MAG TPA: type II toxin-antitoxin system CcdA family antitoxin, partial [Alphaproteobacteria bacterium]|nr:type II toxin-antitoxin system CcdA family antitoxin [Alphaproteobacteria bacterium]